MKQLIKAAKEFNAKVEEYMIEGDAFDDAYDKACDETDVKNYVINQINGQLERWMDKDGAAIVDGIVVASFDELNDLMRWMPQVNVYYLAAESTAVLNDTITLLKNGFTKIEAVEIYRCTTRSDIKTPAVRFERG